MSTKLKEITPQEFFIDNGLYTKIDVLGSDLESVKKVIFYDGAIDCYCLECQQASVFKAVNNLPSDLRMTPMWGNVKYFTNAVYTKDFTCSRNENHKMYFTILFEETELIKIGQYPSFSDIITPSIKEYKSILKDKFSEYNRAVGLYAHGIGVGSFVYLRRIIEQFLIQPAYEKAKSTEVAWDEVAYSGLRVGEKIKKLKRYLPTYLVENASVYSVISKGIHELTEDECKLYFPVVNDILQIILTEIKSEKDKEEKKKKLTQDLKNIVGQLKS